MEKDKNYFANTILTRMAEIYPQYLTYDALLKTDEHWQDYKSQTREGLDFLIHHNLIVAVGLATYQCSSEGRIVYKEGIEKFIQERRKKDDKDAEIKKLSLELLQEQITDIKRKNRNWQFAIIAGVVAFVHMMLQILKVI
jgi:hypothetical protein